jgi:uncharacterized membrane protein YfbV (UPF0208 family)
LNLFFDVLKQGDRYLRLWPKQRTLNCLFVDSKIVFYTQLLIKLCPAFVILLVCLQIAFPLLLNWPTTATIVLFLLGLPVQGLYWLGKRSETLLPHKLVPWYMAIQQKLSGNNKIQTQLIRQPCYLDLAKLLGNAFKLGGDNFLQHHELI